MAYGIKYGEIGVIAARKIVALEAGERNPYFTPYGSVAKKSRPRSATPLSLVQIQLGPPIW